MRSEAEASAEKLAEIAKVCNVSLDWLILGSENAGFERVPAPSPISGHSEQVMVPLLSVQAAAGAGRSDHGEVEIEALLPFSREILRRIGVNPEKIEFIRAAGDSMEDTIKDGDVVLVDRSKRELSADAIYVISIADELRIKRIQKSIDGSITLISDNERRYPPERLSKADAAALRVHGRVVWTEKVL